MEFCHRLGCISTVGVKCNLVATLLAILLPVSGERVLLGSPLLRGLHPGNYEMSELTRGKSGPQRHFLESEGGSFVFLDPEVPSNTKGSSSADEEAQRPVVSEQLRNSDNEEGPEVSVSSQESPRVHLERNPKKQSQ